MNTLFPIITAAVVLGFGYRFYSKLLALWAFRLDINYSTPAQAAPEDTGVGVNRHVVLGYHFAIVAGATTLTGTAIAITWGWIPAFLWVLAGTAVAAGTYSLGSLWLAVRHGGAELPDIAITLLGPRADILFLALTIPLLLSINAVLVWLAAALLIAYPAAVLPFWAQLLIAFGVGMFLHRCHGNKLLAVSFAAVIVTGATLWLLGKLPFAFSGAFNLDIRGYSLLSVDATIVWVVLLLMSAYYASRLPIHRFLQPCGYLAALYTGLLLLALLIGLVLERPVVIAPNFHAPADAPGLIPWIFVTLTSGAIAGFYLLFATGITGRRLPRETDARYVGYGVAIADGLLAVSAIVIAVSAFDTVEQWTGYYASWSGVQDLPKLLVLYIDGFASLVQAMEVSGEFARAFAAFVTLGLIMATFDAGIYVQKNLLAMLGRRYRWPQLGEARVALLVTIVLTGALALYDGHGRGGLEIWPLFGMWNQVLALGGFALMALALQRRQQPIWIVAAPALLLLVVTVWVLPWQLALWWLNASWLLFACGAALLALAVWLGWETVRASKQDAGAAPHA
jgi:carbon starvation protein